MSAKQQEIMRSTYCYSDAQVFGEYPRYLLTYFQNNGITIHKEPEDDEIMQKYPVDFISFSYYNSYCAAEDGRRTGEELECNTAVGYKNPYLKSSDWDGRLIPWGLGFRWWICMTVTAGPFSLWKMGWEQRMC